MLVAAGCGSGGPSATSPAPEAERTPFPPKRLPVAQAAARLLDALDECLGREGMRPARMEGMAQILRDAGVQSPGAVAINVPAPFAILHVVHTRAQGMRVARRTRHMQMAGRGRVVWASEDVRTPEVLRTVLACVDEAERAAPIAR